MTFKVSFHFTISIEISSKTPRYKVPSLKKTVRSEHPRSASDNKVRKAEAEGPSWKTLSF